MSLNFSLWLPQSAAVANFGISFVDAVATAVAVAAAIPVVVASGFSFFGVVILLPLLPGAGAIADILVVVVVMVANNQKSIDHCKMVHKKLTGGSNRKFLRNNTSRWVKSQQGKSHSSYLRQP